MITTIKPRLLYIREVEQIINKSRATLRRWWMNGKFPKPTLLNGFTLAWRTEVIEEWMDNNMM